MCSEYPVEVHMDYPARVATKLKIWSPLRVAVGVAEAKVWILFRVAEAKRLESGGVKNEAIQSKSQGLGS